ncbi:MAG: ATP-dependent sacrificial sulfur transferase LarE [Blautia sp.]|jgi:uncharacterized protein
MRTEEKRKWLLDKMDEYGREDFAVAFSGGVDSSLLLYLAVDAAKRHGKKVYALTADTVLHPSQDRRIAEDVARRAGAEHKVVFVDELKDSEILKNPVDRCYLCKKQLFTEFIKLCGELGAACILEGSNGDDLLVYRPGIRAVRELGVESPLAEAGLTKAEVRAFAAELGIPTAKRPSTPCMATRLPYGAMLEPRLLARIDEGEQFLKRLGFGQVRIRVHGDIVRLEVLPEDFDAVLQRRDEVIRGLKELGFRYLTLDLEGFRSGSMDEYMDKASDMFS